VVDLYPIAVNDVDYDLFLGKELTLMKADPEERWRDNFVIKTVPEESKPDKIEKVKDLLEGNGYTVRVHERIERIHFDFDKWDIRPSEYEKLNRVAGLLNTYSQTQVVIGAHTDKRGSDSYNMTLSKKRAQSTVDYLISQGVKSSRMKSVAYGESMLLIVCDECSEDEHQQNRRVTFDVTLDD
jgi:outer membrane protein OmpA-like peptidoglycan-associated protein